MLASFRLPLNATAVALVVGVSAVALSPHPGADVALAAFDNLLPELVDTDLLINNDLFNGLDVFGGYEWQPYQGLIPQLVYTALPIVSQLTDNWSSYIGGTVEDLGTSVKILGDAA